MSLGILSLLFLFLGDNENVNYPGNGMADMDDAGFDIEQEQLRARAREELERQRDALKHIAVAAEAHAKYESNMRRLANTLKTTLNGSYWDDAILNKAEEQAAQEYQKEYKKALEKSGAKAAHTKHDKKMRNLANEARILISTLNGKYWQNGGGKKLKYRRRKTKKMGNRKHKKTMRRKGKRRNRRTKKR
mgnify:CR=1 FL=1|tara:strand:+ start:1389 stop:1958 length:570 start_codon:yes stop_codon:yes gene_type:complete